MGLKPPYNRHNWPIAAGMNQYPNTLPNGSSVQDQRPEEWALAVQDVADAGFTEIDPTDSWIRLADLEPSRGGNCWMSLKREGLTIPAITTARRSIIDPEHGDEYFAYMRRVIDVAAEIGAAEMSIGFTRHRSAPLAPRRALARRGFYFVPRRTIRYFTESHRLG